MPAGLYAISFKKTGNLLALASFEKRALPDQPARDALFASLVGKNFPMAIGPDDDPPIKLAPEHVAVDFVKGPAQPQSIIANLYSYRLDLSVQGTTPGDATDKTLVAANANQVMKLRLNKTTRQVEVTLATAEGTIPQPVYLLFQGIDPIPHTTTALQSLVTIPLDPSVILDPTKHYAFVFIKNDTPVTPGYLPPT